MNIPDGLSFGTALILLKQGKKVARQGWNGKNLYLFFVTPGSNTSPTGVSPMFLPQSVFDLAHAKQDPFICMKTATGSVQPGWLASQVDLLANDWVEVE